MSEDEASRHPASTAIRHQSRLQIPPWVIQLHELSYGYGRWPTWSARGWDLSAKIS